MSRPAALRASVIAVIVASGLCQSGPAGCAEKQPVPSTTANVGQRPDYLALIRGHFDGVLRTGRDGYGPDKTPLWLSAIDVRKGGLPERPDPKLRHWYRTIHAPNGSTLYWDQPALVAAIAVSRLTGDPRYEQAARDYVAEFLKRCVSPANGLFMWGNHIYYDVTTDQLVKIGAWHREARPLPPAWELFWNADPAATARAIRQVGQQHVVDPQSGEFNRHGSTEKRPDAHGTTGCPFLEAGGIICESLCWLAAKQGGHDEGLTDLALRVARFSYNARDPQTGLVRNKPGADRWDFHVSTTEIGLWADSLLRSAEYTGVEEFREMAQQAVAAYLRFGWDEANGQYWGSVRVTDGKPWLDRATEYQPGKYSDPWLQATCPTHDYPMSMAEACLTLSQQTGQPEFRQAAERWTQVVRASLPANQGHGAWADQYGRCIHFLVRAAAILDRPELNTLAHRVADEAIEQLYLPDCRMFRSHPGEDRCNAVDGPGILFLALIYLQTGTEPHGFGFAF